MTAAPEVTGYKIQYRPTGSSDAWTELTGTAADATSETVTGLTEWVSHDVQVLANNGTDGAWSATVAGIPHRDVTLSAAGSVDGLASDGTTMWTTVPGSTTATGYQLSDGNATPKNIAFALGTDPTGICAANSKVWVAQSDPLT